MAYNGTLTGAAVLQTPAANAQATGCFGTAALNPGGGNVSIPPAALAFGASDTWTIDIRFNITAAQISAGAYQTIIGNVDASYNGFTLGLQNGNFGGYTLNSSRFNTGIPVTPGWVNARWIVRKGTRIETWVEGHLVSVTSVPGGYAPPPGASYAGIGDLSAPSVINDPFKGLIDYVSISRGGRTLYTYGVPTTTPSLSLVNQIALYALDADATDSNTAVPATAPGNYPLILAGATPPTFNAPGITGSGDLLLTGAGYATTNDNGGPFDVPVGASFEVSTQIKTTNAAAGSTVVCGQYGSWWIGMTNGKASAMVANGTSITSVIPINDGLPHEVDLLCQQASGNSNLWTLRVDGAPVAPPVTATHIRDAGAAAQIGAYNGTLFWTGEIDEVSVASATVRPDYYTPLTTTTPATREQQIALWHFDGDLSDANTNLSAQTGGNFAGASQVGALYGQTFALSVQTGFSSLKEMTGGAAYLPGSLDFGPTQSWDVEFEISDASTVTNPVLLVGTNWELILYGHVLMVGYIDAVAGYTNVQSPTTINNGSYHHGVITCRAGKTLTIDLDGVQSIQQAISFVGVSAAQQLSVSDPRNQITIPSGVTLKQLAVSRGVQHVAPFTPPRGPISTNRAGLIALYALNGDLTDSCTNPTPAGNTYSVGTGGTLPHKRSPYNWGSDATGLHTTAAGAYVEVEYSGSQVWGFVNNLAPLSTPNATYPFIKTRIDGGNWQPISQVLNPNALVNFTPVPPVPGKHILEIAVAGLENGYRDRFALGGTYAYPTGSFTLTRLLFEDDVTPIAPPAKSYKAFITGDSIFDGIQQPAGIDATLTAAYALKKWMEVGIVAISGVGWVNGGLDGYPQFKNAYGYLWSGVLRHFDGSSVDAPQPDLWINQVGTNDFGQAQQPDSSPIITAEVGAAFNYIYAQAPSMKALLVSPFPRADTGHVDAQPMGVAMSAVAASTNAPARVTYASTAGLFDPTDTGFASDHLHPTQLCHDSAIAPFLFKTVAQTLFAATLSAADVANVANAVAAKVLATPSVPLAVDPATGNVFATFDGQNRLELSALVENGLEHHGWTQARATFLDTLSGLVATVAAAVWQDRIASGDFATTGSIGSLISALTPSNIAATTITQFKAVPLSANPTVGTYDEAMVAARAGTFGDKSLSGTNMSILAHDHSTTIRTLNFTPTIAAPTSVTSNH